MVRTIIPYEARRASAAWIKAVKKRVIPHDLCTPNESLI
jgi:hypothetical protein